MNYPAYWMVVYQPLFCSEWPTTGGTQLTYGIDEKNFELIRVPESWDSLPEIKPRTDEREGK